VQDKSDLFAKETTATAPESTREAELISGEDKPHPFLNQSNEGWRNDLGNVMEIAKSPTRVVCLN